MRGKAVKKAKAGARGKGMPLRHRLIAVIVAAIAAFGAVFGVAGAAMADGSNNNQNNLSMYNVASSVAGFFSAATAPAGSNGKKDDSNWHAIEGDASSGGSMIGYADKNLLQDPTGWLLQQSSGTSESMTYASLGQLGSQYSGVKHFAEYGATLQALGLDSTGTGLQSNILNWVAGGIMWLAFALTASVDWAFNLVLTMLQFLNPFKLLFDGVKAVAPNFASGISGGGTSGVWAPLAGLEQFVSGVYTAVSGLSWAVLVPLFIALTLFFVILGKQGRGNRLRKLAVRVLFIVIGIPLLGSMYTGTLSSMQQATSGADSGSVQVVTSTYVDFGAWAQQARLAIPSGATIQWDESGNQPTAASQAGARNSAEAINAMTHSEWKNLSSPFSGGSASSFIDAASGNAGSGGSNTAFLSALNMIGQYMSGQQVSSANFASAVQAGVTGGPDAQNVGKAFSNITQAGDLNSITPDSNPLLTVSPGTGMKASQSGSTVDFSTPSASQNASCGTQIVTNNQGYRPSCNLSPLSMYNYLNSSFANTGYTVYSAGGVASSAVQQVHNAVSPVGSGVMGFVNWVQSLTLLSAFVVIGFGYAAALLIGNIRNGVKMLTATPFAMLGAIAGITKVIVYAAAMVLEIFATIFLYKVVQQLLLALPGITSWASQALSGNSVTAGGFLVGMAVFSTLIVLVFTIMAMRLRKTVVKGINEAVTKVVESITGGQTTPPGGPGMGARMAGAAAGGAAAGAGMALGSQMMGNKSGGDGAKPGPEAANASGTQDIEASGTGEADGGTGMAPAVSPDGGQDGPGGPDGGEGGDGATSRQAAEADRTLGESVAANGLSVAGSGEQQPRSVKGQPSGDAMDTMASSAAQDKSRRGQEASFRKQAGTQAFTGAIHGGMAVARGYAGDTKGAVTEGAKAAQSLQAANQSSRGAQKKREAIRKDDGTPGGKQAAAEPAVPKRKVGAPPQRELPIPTGAAKED